MLTNGLAHCGSNINYFALIRNFCIYQRGQFHQVKSFIKLVNYAILSKYLYKICVTNAVSIKQI